MGTRRKSRELAMQALFYMDTNGDISLENLELYCSNFQPDANVRPFFLKLAKGVINARSKVDAAIERFSSNWKMHRMSGVDRNVLRLAVYEVLFCDDIPVKVSINEAIDIGKKFGSSESGAFINGILDSIRLALEKGELKKEGAVPRDNQEKRCPRLGGPVPFKYCMDTGDGTGPCFKIMDCWWEDFDIRSYLEQNVSPEALNRLVKAKPPPKVTSLVELIEQAKKRTAE
ncbi:MAG: transcription antitermination factor NusB [Thermodesulfobacteriota bacterium]